MRVKFLSAANQERVIELEDELHRSQWAIAKSARLLRVLEVARGNGIYKLTG
jgi:hypothetical protein